MQKIGTLGGTFDPIHRGHLLIAETARTQLQLDQILWVPGRQPPHKSGQAEPLLAFKHRLAMVRQAIAPYPGFVLPPLDELYDPTPQVSYAIDTLRALQVLYPLAEWYWIIGLDAFQTLPRWRARQSLAQSCCWLVAPRTAASDQSATLAQTCQQAEAVCQTVAQRLEAEAIALRWQVLEMQPLDISSRLIRRYCRQQQPIDELVPESVRDYIQRYSLYRDLVFES